MADRGMPVAARFLDGRVVKGWTENIRPQGMFHMLEEGSGSPVCIKTNELKAVFFIKTLKGNPTHDDCKEFERRKGTGTKLWVEFADGEELAGWSNSYNRDKAGFYLHPTDPDSNINMAYILRPAVRKIRTGAFAARAARLHRESQRSRGARTSYSPERWEDFLEAPRF